MSSNISATSKTEPIQKTRTISMQSSIAYFILSLVINSAGNVLTLVTSAKIHPSYLGAAYWTAATANFGDALNWNLFWAFIIIGVLTVILNAILIDRSLVLVKSNRKYDFYGSFLSIDSGFR